MKVTEVKDLSWSFDGNGPLCYNDGLSDRMDPCPAYAHDAKLVRKLAVETVQALTVPHKVDLYIYHYEGLNRTNGYAYKADWENKGVIVLFGKRIPIHPAMTRYLVAHEYGHHVEYALDELRGAEGVIREEYQKLRGGVLENYGPGTWHNSTREILANDFRILITGQETEFWPHPGVNHPHDNKEVQRWWVDAVAEIEGVK